MLGIMANPLQRLKFLPWRSLAGVTVLTLAIALLLELVLGVSFYQIPIVQLLLAPLFSPPWILVTILAAGVGVGALATLLLEKVFPLVRINNSVLWALILCLVLGLILRSFIPLPAILTNANSTQFMGIVLGTFWKGRAYWHR